MHTACPEPPSRTTNPWRYCTSASTATPTTKAAALIHCIAETVQYGWRAIASATSLCHAEP